MGMDKASRRWGWVIPVEVGKGLASRWGMGEASRNV